MSLEDDTLPGADPAPGPDPVFEWLGGVITTAVHLLGVPVNSTGTVTEERRHHASWTWPASGRSVALVETIPHARQILSVRSGGRVAWYEGQALRWFPGMEEMILRGLGIQPPVRSIRSLGWKPDAPGYPPLP